MQPNSIHLPRLAYFSCQVTQARALLQGLAAPNLTHVGYTQSYYESEYVALEGIQSRWASVPELSFPSNRPGYRRASPLRLYLAAPNVRGLEIMSEDLGAFLEPKDGLYLIDRWEHLERLVIIGVVQKLEDSGDGWYHGSRSE